jgi:hypothetical protein
MQLLDSRGVCGLPLQWRNCSSRRIYPCALVLRKRGLYTGAPVRYCSCRSLVWQTVILEPTCGPLVTAPLHCHCQPGCKGRSPRTGKDTKERSLRALRAGKRLRARPPRGHSVIQDGERVIMSQAGGRRRWPADASRGFDHARLLLTILYPALHAAGPPAQADLQTKVARQRATQLACTAGARCSAAGVCVAVAHSLVDVPGPYGLSAILISWLTRLVRCFCFARRPSLS